MTYYEKLISSPIEYAVADYVAAIEWARNLSNNKWREIVCGNSGLEKFVLDALNMDVADEEDQ